MAQAGVYAPSSVVRAEATVRVNGVVREHVSMDWSGDTTGGLPDQVVSAGTGMRSRTGRIVWAQQDPVQADPPHPLRRAAGWPPREGDEVVIDATVDTGQGPYTWRRFTGRLGRTTGSLTDGTLTSEVTDTLADSLHELVTVPPLVRIFGSESPSGWTVAYRALEAAGMGHLPPPDGDTVAHFAGQGESTVSVGALTNLTSSYDEPGYGQWVRSPSVIPVASARAGRDVLVIGRGSVSYTSWVRARLDNGSSVMLGIDLTGRMTLRVNDAAVWSGQWADESPVPVLAFQLLPSGIRVWTSRDTYTTAVPTVVSRTALLEHVDGGFTSGVSARYLGSSARAAGLVADVASRPVSWTYSPLAMPTLRMTRGVENRTVREVVDAWAEATLTSLWMDERGTPISRTRDTLVNAPVARTVRVDEKVFSGSWSIGDDQVRSSVILTGQQGALGASPTGQYRVPVHKESGVRAVESPETFDRFIEAPAEEEWGPIDLTPSRWTSNASVSGDLPARGTWIHAVVQYDGGGGEEDRWAWDNVPSPSVYTASIERLGQRTLKLVEQVTPGAGVETVYLKSPERKPFTDPGRIRPAYRDVPSPVIRAAWVSTWSDYLVTSGTRGPSWAPMLELDVSWFLDPDTAQIVADALAAEVTEPIPTFSGVGILWDPTRQIGDVEEWVAVDRRGRESWRARVLVSGYSESWDGDVPSQSVDVRVISWTDPHEGKTYADLAAAYATYAGMAGGTYQQVHDALPNTI